MYLCTSGCQDSFSGARHHPGQRLQHLQLLYPFPHPPNSVPMGPQAGCLIISSCLSGPFIKPKSLPRWSLMPFQTWCSRILDKSPTCIVYVPTSGATTWLMGKNSLDFPLSLGIPPTCGGLMAPTPPQCFPMALTSSSPLAATFSRIVMNHQSWSPKHQASEKALPHSDQIQSPFGRLVGRMELVTFNKNCSAALPSWRGMQLWNGCLHWAFCTGRGSAYAPALSPYSLFTR